MAGKTVQDVLQRFLPSPAKSLPWLLQETGVS
jgi:hypothetical protein